MTITPSNKRYVDTLKIKPIPCDMEKVSIEVTLISLAKWLGRHSAKKASAEQNKSTHTIH